MFSHRCHLCTAVLPTPSMDSFLWMSLTGKPSVGFIDKQQRHSAPRESFASRTVHQPLSNRHIKLDEVTGSRFGPLKHTHQIEHLSFAAIHERYCRHSFSHEPSRAACARIIRQRGATTAMHCYKANTTRSLGRVICRGVRRIQTPDPGLKRRDPGSIGRSWFGKVQGDHTKS
jgi:hypothetical protein